MNAAVDIYCPIIQIYIYEKKESDCCPLCRETQTLIHMLNNCKVTLCQRREYECHDKVLQSIVAKKLPSTTNFTADLGATYHFPLHIAPTDLHIDMVSEAVMVCNCLL